MKKAGLSFFSLLAIAILAAIATAGEAPYPARPVRLLVSQQPAGTVDLIARVLAPKLTAQMGRPFVVENKPGAGGIVCAELLATAKHDGYTLGVIFNSFTTNVALRKISSYDPVKDIAPIALVIKQPLILASFPGLGLQSVRDLIALAKTKPLIWSSGGIGTGSHLGGELFHLMAGINATHVPCTGGAAATTEVVTGRVQYTFQGPTVFLPWVKQGRLTLLAVTSLKRNASWPELPTIHESGVPGLESVSWFGFVAPAGTPRSIIDRLNREIIAALQLKDVHQKLSEGGAEIEASTPEAMGTFIAKDLEKWKNVIRTANITVD